MRQVTLRSACDEVGITMVTTDAGTLSGQPGADPTGADTTVVFRGDGEPASPRALLNRLAEIEAGSGFEPDSYSLGGSVAALERYFADALGKEAAIFMPTGTLANHLAIRALCGGRPRAVVQEQSHLYQDSGDCVTRLSSINLIPLAQGRPAFHLDELKEAVAGSTSGRVASPVGAVMVESPVRRQQGQVVPYPEMQAITGYCRSQGIHTHLDGARLYMMSAATGIAPQEYAALFDTVYVSLYKYFGAPFGAVLAGDSHWIEGMYHTRRMFGGGLSSAYLAAALALQGARGFEERFEKAMRKGRDLFKLLNCLDGIQVNEFEHGSNIFPVSLADGVNPETMTDVLRRNGVHIFLPEDPDAGLTLTVNTTILRQPNEAIRSAFAQALEESRVPV